jgi:hypothetical protein
MSQRLGLARSEDIAVSNGQPDHPGSSQPAALASRQRAAKTIFRFFFGAGWIVLALELFYLYRDPDFGYFDLFLSCLSALGFLSAWQFRLLTRRLSGEPTYHPMMIPMSLLFLVMLFALAMVFFG